MPTNSWIAEEAGQASDPTKWSLGRIPQNDDDIDIGTASDNNIDWNISGLSLAGFDMSNLSGSGIVSLTYGFGCTSLSAAESGGNMNGSGKTVTCSGNASAPRTSTPYSLIMIGEGTTLLTRGVNALAKVTIDANISSTGNISTYVLETATDKELAVGSGHALKVYVYGGAWTNNGSVSGDGKAILYPRYATTVPLDLGECNINVDIIGYASATVDNSVTLTANAHFDGDLTVKSDSAYTCSLLHGSNYGLEVDGVTTLGVRGVMNQGTAQWDFDGGYVQNGASSVFTQGAEIASGDVSISDGTVNLVNTKTWTCDGDFIRTGATFTTHGLNLIMTKDSSTLTLNGQYSQRFKFSANVTHAGTSGTVYVGEVEVDPGKTLTLNKDLWVYRATFVVKVTNNGSIDGASILFVYPHSSSHTGLVALGNISCPVFIRAHSGTTGDNNVQLTSEASLANLTIDSLNPTYSMIVDLNGQTLNADLVTLSTRSRLTGSGTINAPVTASAGLLTQTGDVEVNGDITVSGGVWAGVIGSKFYCSGNVNRTSGTVNPSVLSLVLTGIDKVFDMNDTSDAYKLLDLQIDGTISCEGSVCRLQRTLTVNGTLTNNGTISMYVSYQTTTPFSGTGTITGSGTILYIIVNSSGSIDWGDVVQDCAIQIGADGTGRTTTFLSDLSASKTVLLSTSHTGAVLNLGGYGITASAVTISTNWTVTGSGTIDGPVTVSAGTLNNTGEMSVTGLITVSGGLLDQDAVLHSYGGVSVTNGTVTGPSTYTLPLILHDCDFLHTGGTVTGTTVTFKTYGECTVTCTGTACAFIVTAGSICTKTTSNTISRRIETEVGGELILGNSCEFRYYSTSSYQNLGKVSGAGKTLQLSLYDADKTIDLGDISCDVRVRALTVTTADRTLSLTGEEALPGSIMVDSQHPTYKATLDQAGHHLTAKNIVASTLGRILGDGGTSYTGNWDTSLGEFDAESCTVEKIGTGTEKLGAGQSFYNYTAEVEPLDLASDLTISNVYRHARAAVLNGYTLTLTDQTKEQNLFVPKRTLAGSYVTKTTIGGEMDDTD